IELAAGDPAAAERAARGAVDVAAAAPPLPLNLSESLAILAQTLLAQRRADDARTAAAEALRMLEELGGIDDGGAVIRLTWAEALDATGDPAGARAAILAARERLLHRAHKIADPATRDSFLNVVPENARTLVLAREWEERRVGG